MKINSINNSCRPNFGILKIDGHNFQKCNPAKNRDVKRFLEYIDPETFNAFSDVYNRQIGNNIMDIDIRFDKTGKKYGVFITPAKCYKVLPNGKSNYKPNENAEVTGKSLSEALNFADTLASAEKDLITSFIA